MSHLHLDRHNLLIQSPFYTPTCSSPLLELFGKLFYAAEPFFPSASSSESFMILTL